MDGRDVALVGLSVDISGAILLARGFMMKGVLDIYDETGTRLGRNLAMVKSAMLQRVEAWAGAGLLFVGFALQILAALEVRSGSRLIVGWWGLAELLALAAVLFVACFRTCTWLGRRQFYEWALRNWDGKGFTLPKDSHEEQELDHYGRLYDVQRRNGEDVSAFLARLNAAIAELGKRHRGKLALPCDTKKQSAA
jgi:signal transduction histidine kinase